MTWFSYRNFVRGATLTATRQSGANGPHKLAFLPSTERWRAGDLSEGDVDTDLDISFQNSKGEPFARRPEVIAMQRVRRRLDQEEDEAPSFLASDEIRHQLSATDDFTTPLYDTGFAASEMLLGHGLAVAFPPDPGGQAGQYARATLRATSRATVPDNYVDFGYIWYGRIDFEPSIDYGAPHQLDFDEPVEQRVSDDGSSTIIRRKAMRRRLSLNFRSIKPGEIDGLYDFLSYAGSGGVFLVGLDRPTDVGADVPRNTMFARFARASRQRAAKRLYRAPFQLVEAI